MNERFNVKKLMLIAYKLIKKIQKSKYNKNNLIVK